MKVTGKNQRGSEDQNKVALADDPRRKATWKARAISISPSLSVEEVKQGTCYVALGSIAGPCMGCLKEGNTRETLLLVLI